MRSDNERRQFIRNAMKFDVERKDRLKRFAYDSWVIFYKMKPESESFKVYIDLIDGYLGVLKSDFDYTPEWAEVYNERRLLYWNPMKIKVEKEIQKMELDTAIEMQIADTGIYHSFKHRNLLLEFILN